MGWFRKRDAVREAELNRAKAEVLGYAVTHGFVFTRSGLVSYPWYVGFEGERCTDLIAVDETSAHAWTQLHARLKRAFDRRKAAHKAAAEEAARKAEIRSAVDEALDGRGLGDSARQYEGATVSVDGVTRRIVSYTPGLSVDWSAPTQPLTEDRVQRMIEVAMADCRHRIDKRVAEEQEERKGASKRLHLRINRLEKRVVDDGKIIGGALDRLDDHDHTLGVLHKTTDYLDGALAREINSNTDFQAATRKALEALAAKPKKARKK